jgi:hypothetical protein
MIQIEDESLIFCKVVVETAANCAPNGPCGQWGLVQGMSLKSVFTCRIYRRAAYSVHNNVQYTMCVFISRQLTVKQMILLVPSSLL